MCYSLAASVNAGIALSVIGAATVRKARLNDPRMLGFAVFPLVFSAHQFVEGVVWWSLERPFAGEEFYRYFYTIIAFLVWPVLTPFAATMAEADPRRRKIWAAMTGCGVLLALYLAVRLADADGIDVSVVKHSLAYDPQFERPPLIVDILYLGLTVVPLIGADNRALKLFGATVLGAFIYALIQNRAAWYSLWCMSAAIFSLIVSFAIKDVAKSDYEKVGAQADS
ncbi:DUF6629 family protein [Methylocystis heyeri]|uniref:Uncharacterized protein n=1 Tax=Methylocystis heyeri TaxID=391905 RepID=A0A6B8KDI8_9HYPH|nr:DUF6629 family protein [Methylocystis heyeri]QGM46316.1 hypothetical protein H2LOC_011755 [Methylocystis heyeri]